ncbi:MAG TPA: C4-type zinc ribbon domain-containing protein [Candidatus Aquicultor sp.]|jgi:predicted  nucleic acid-binding Zn-ribbon protein
MDDHQKLLELQEIDTKIDALNYREKNPPERDRFVLLSEEAKKMGSLHAAFEKKLHDEAVIQKRLEDQLTSLNAKIKKEQKLLYGGTINNPKELAGVQQEVEHLTGHADEKELELLEQIDVVDKLKHDEKIVADRLKAKKAEVEQAKAALDKVRSEINTERDKLTSEREPIVAALSEDVRELYLRTRTKYSLAVTVMEEGLCRGCRVEVPSTDAERIAASSKLEKCPSCGRIIVKK